VLPAAEIAAAIERAHAWLPPSITLDALGTVACVWALAEPLDVSSAQGQAAARALLRSLDAAAGGGTIESEEEIDLASLTVPLPGAAVREDPERHEVSIVDLDLSRVYTIEDITAAIAAPEEHQSV
jgi:hypothetical protein